MNRAINKISNEIFDAFLICSYKSFLLSSGLKGEKSDYIELISRLDNEYRVVASNRLAIAAGKRTGGKYSKMSISRIAYRGRNLLQCLRHF